MSTIVDRAASRIGFATLAVTLLLAACADRPSGPTGLDPLPLPILDLSASASVDGFVFLPPLGANPRSRTGFDGSLDVVVDVCAGTPCVSHASFSVGDGTVTVDAADQQYVAEWKPAATGAVAGTTYTIRVLVGDQVLGSASVLVTESGKSRITPAPGVVAVTQASTLPIKFHVTEGTVPSSPVLFQSRYWDPSLPLPAQDGAAYLSAIDTMVAKPATEGFCDAPLTTWADLANKFVCPSGSNSNFAFKVTAKVDIPADRAGTWYLRLGADAGRGAVWSLDGVPQAFLSSGWHPTQLFVATVALTAGRHTIVFAGIEDCCDGAPTSTISSDNSTWSVIPELPAPTSLAQPPVR